MPLATLIDALIILTITPLSGLFILSKCFFLAPYPVGWLLMFANIVYDTFFKKFKWPRWQVDLAFFLVVVVGATCVLPSWLSVGIATIMAVTWALSLKIDLEWRTGGNLARQHPSYAGKAPLPVPRLIVHARGPILRRKRGIYSLGTWLVGERQPFRIIVLNPSVVRPQFPLEATMSTSGNEIGISVPEKTTLACPEPGEIAFINFELSAKATCVSGHVAVHLRHGDFAWQCELNLERIVAKDTATVRRASISKWKYGARAGFAWRGDHDLYDPATFQSEEGLRQTLGLSRRLRIPSTLFMSGRLSLVEDEHREFCEKHGWDRHSEEIPSFIEFTKTAIDRRVEQDWPFQTTDNQPFAAEIGNHTYLHYGTHAAADPGNNWKPRAKMGDGRYPWQEPGDASSFTEQRDNVIKNAEVFSKLTNTEMITYAIPSDVFDANTARAIEAAGLEVGSDTDASRWVRVMKLPPPHHPVGCDTLVELTRKYPKDPADAYSVATLKYWAYTAMRLRRVFVLLSHHHLLWYEGVSCFHSTEEILRHVLQDHDGQFYVATMGALGRYWRDVLSPTKRCVEITASTHRITVTNSGSRALEALPLEIELENGARFMRLVDVPANGALLVEL